MIILQATKYLIFDICFEKLFNGISSNLIRTPIKLEIGKTYVLTLWKDDDMYGNETQPLIYHGTYSNSVDKLRFLSPAGYLHLDIGEIASFKEVF